MIEIRPVHWLGALSLSLALHTFAIYLVYSSPGGTLGGADRSVMVTLSPGITPALAAVTPDLEAVTDAPLQESGYADEPASDARHFESSPTHDLVHESGDVVLAKDDPVLPIVERSPAVDVDSDVEVVEPRTVVSDTVQPVDAISPLPEDALSTPSGAVVESRRTSEEAARGQSGDDIQATEPQPAASDVTESVAAAPLPAEQAPSVRSSTVVETRSTSEEAARAEPGGENRDAEPQPAPSDTTESMTAASPAPEEALSAPSGAVVEARSAALEPAPVDSTGSVDAVKRDYYIELAAWLERKKRYPRSSRRRGEQGVVGVEFVIDREGRLLEQRVVKSSGYRLLDEEAAAIVRRAAPMPPIPAELGHHRLVITAPISFSLK